MSADAISRPVARVLVPADRIRPVSFWAVLRATVIMNLQVAARYLPNLLGDIASLGMRVLFFLFLAGIAIFPGQEVLGRTLTLRDIFVFYQGAILLFLFKGTALWTPLEAVSNDLYNGTLEFLYSNPISRYAYYMGTIISSVLVSQIAFLPLYLILILVAHGSLFNMFMVFVVSVAVFVVLTALGVMVGTLGLLWRRASSVAGIVEICFEMLSGAYFPLVALPRAIQLISYPLPFTWGYDLVRYYSFDGQWHTILPVWQEWIILLVFGLVFTILSRYLLAKAELYAKRNGLNLL